MTNAEHSPTLAELHQQLVTIRKRQLHIEANENPIERTQQEDELSELTDWLEAQIAAFPHQDE